MTMRSLALSLMLLLVPSYVLAGGDVVTEEFFVAGNALEYYEPKLGNDLLHQYGERAFRTDSVTLNIVTGQGDTVVFSDVMSIDGTCYETICYLVDYFPEHDIWVVEQQGYEWVDWLLLNGTTGEYQRAISEPVLSPDGTRLLCSYRDVIAAFNFNGVQIWRVGPDSLVPEFNEKNVSWAPSNVAWDGDSTVRVNMITVDWEEWTGTVRPTYIELTPEGQWVPEDPELW